MNGIEPSSFTHHSSEGCVLAKPSIRWPICVIAVKYYESDESESGLGGRGAASLREKGTESSE